MIMTKYDNVDLIPLFVASFSLTLFLDECNCVPIMTKTIALALVLILPPNAVTLATTMKPCRANALNTN